MMVEGLQIRGELPGFTGCRGRGAKNQLIDKYIFFYNAHSSWSPVLGKYERFPREVSLSSCELECIYYLLPHCERWVFI